MSDLTKKSFLNFFTSVVKSIGLMCLTFLMTPLLLKLIGAKDFGTFKVLMEIHGYLGLLEMGLFASLISGIIPLIRSDNKEKLQGLLSEGMKRYWKVAFWTLGVGLLLMPFLKKFTSWDGGSEIYITFGLILMTAFFIPSLNYKAYLEASNRGHLVNLIIFFQNLSFILIGVLCAYWGWALSSQGIAALISGALGAYLLRYYSGIKIKLKNGHHHSSSEHITRHRKSQILNEMAHKLCLHCDQLVIAILIGPVMVTKVFLGQRVVQIIQGQLLSMGQASWASLSSLYYEKESHQGLFEKRVMEMTKVLATSAVALLIPICILNQSFIALWVGESYLMDSNALTYLAAANAFFFSLFSFWAFLFTVLGKPAEITKMIWKQAIINVIASLVFTKYVGGVGPIAGTLLSYLLVPLWIYPHLLKEHFDLSSSKLFSSIIMPGAAGFIIVLAYHFSPWKFESLTWPLFFVSGFVLFFSFSIILFFLLFNQSEKEIFISRLGRLWKNLVTKKF